MITNIVLGMILRDDREMLERCAPTFAAEFAHKVVLDTGSTDGGWKYLESQGWMPVITKWTGDYSQARQTLLGFVETTFGHDARWLLMLDADECMTVEDLRALSDFLNGVSADIVRLPRYNLAGPEFKWFKHGYPDGQTRVIRLNAGIKFQGAVHEQAVSVCEIVLAPFHIYHYGYCRSPRKVWLRHMNYTQIADGAPELDERTVIYPPDIDTYITRHGLDEFGRPHPLAP